MSAASSRSPIVVPHQVFSEQEGPGIKLVIFYYCFFKFTSGDNKIKVSCFYHIIHDTIMDGNGA